MKKKIFSVFFALVLVLSFSLATAVPAGAVEPTTLNVVPFELAIGEYDGEGDEDCLSEWSALEGEIAVHLETGPMESPPGLDWPSDGDEARIVIPMPAGTTLDDIESIAWSVYAVAGYPPHVDIYLDVDGDTVVDDEDVLTVEMHGTNNADPVFEFMDMIAKVNHGTWLETFELTSGDGYGTVNDTSEVWLSKLGGGPGDAPSSTLGNWKLGLVDGDPESEITPGVIDATAPVLRLEIEVDNWMIESEAYVDDITINGVTYYGSIQDAIDVASPYDTIIVAEGTYAEYLHITTDHLTIEGAGIDQSIIDLDGLIPYWHYGTNKSFASRAGVLITGYGSPDQIIEGVTFRGFTVKNAGLNPPITATGTHTGADDAAVLTDSTKSWETDALVEQWVHNYGDRDTDYKPARSYGQITANTETTVTVVSLSGDLRYQDCDWDNGDPYLITPYEEFHNSFWIHYPNYDGLRGISIGNGKNILIQYCKVTDSGYGGITTGYARLVSEHQYSEYITIDNCITSDNPTTGISIGNNVGPFTVTNNVCERNKRPAYHDATREFSGYGIHVSGTKDYGMASGLIADNIIRDNGFEGIIVSKYTDGVIVEDNTVTGHNFDQDGAGIFMYHTNNPALCTNHIVRDNVVTGNIRGIVAYYVSNSVIESNTITTDSGAFDSGQAAIKIDGGNNIVVKNNTISNCDGAGINVQNTWNGVESYANTFTGNTITGAKFAGVLIWKGTHDNTFEYNTITGTTTLTRWAGKDYEETQGDGVFIPGYPFIQPSSGLPYPACTGNVFHSNNIYDNEDDGMENQTATEVDAILNWWGGDISGPYHATTNPSGTGDKVVGNVLYFPWAIELVVSGVDPITFDETLELNADWTLVSVDKAVASAAWTATLTLKYTPTGGFVEAFPSDLGPLTAIYIKTVGGGGIGFNYAEVGPTTVYSKELEAGWNLISIPGMEDIYGILSPLRYVTAGTQQVVGLTTLVSQGEYNLSEESFYQATLTDGDWGNLPTLEPFCGYWANMEAAETFEVIPVP